MDVKVSADFSDIDAYFDDGRQAVDSAMMEAGENAVEHARSHGNYQDRTGQLRRSNKCSVNDGTLTLYNDATSPGGFQYGAVVESKGYDVLSSAALNAESELKKRFEQ